MSAEWLAKLTANSIRITGEGFGGTPDITWNDVAGALAGTKRIGYLLLLAKYTGDRGATSAFISELAIEIKSEKNCDTPKALRVAVACSFPVLHPMRCGCCQGRGVIYPKEKGRTLKETARPCRHCDGTGYSQLSERKRAGIAGIPSSTWFDSWKDYTNKKESFLWGIESTCLSILRKNIKEVA